MGTLKNCKKIVVIKNQSNKGYPKAINQGIKISLSKGGEYLLITNNDVLFYEDTIDQLIKGMNLKISNYVTALDKKRNYKTVEQKHLNGDLFWEGLCNSCFIINKSLVEKIGYYDENFGLGNDEDRDYLHRLALHKEEAKAYIPAMIEHEHGYTQARAMSNSNERLFRNRNYLNTKHNIKVGW